MTSLWKTLNYALLLLSLPRLGLAQNLTDGQTNSVVQRLAQGATESWEIGTRSQALLEHSNSLYSVFFTGGDLTTANNDSDRHGAFIPPPTSVPSNSTDDLAPVIEIARQVVGNRTRLNGNITGNQALMQDGSAADPASIGVAVLIANWTGADQPSGSVEYAQAAQEQLGYLLEDVPKSDDGAISHRVAQLQLWSDFIYMVPPFFAYYGVLTGNETLISEAYNQIKLYRDQLRDDDADGLWKHIVLGSGGNGEPGNDEGHWSTGNAWAAAGMLRVLATIQHSEFSDSFRNEQGDLQNWVFEIHDAMYPHLDDNNLFHNYADDDSTFDDAASTALLAATVYRLALLRNVWHYLPEAERCRQTLFASDENGQLQHFDSNGWLTPVVNPNSYGQEGRQSPEAQAFVLDLQAAWSDWVQAGSVGANDGTRTRPVPVVVHLVLGAAVLILMRPL